MNLFFTKTLLFLSLVPCYMCYVPVRRKNVVAGGDSKVKTTTHHGTDVLLTTDFRSNHSEIAVLVVRYSLKLSVSDICGGIPVAERTVITAAHCLYDPKSGNKNYPHRVRVEKGKGGVYTKVGSRYGVGTLAKVIAIHPNYSLYGKMNDIGAIQLRAGIGTSVTITRPTLAMICSWDHGARLEMLVFFIEDENTRRVVSTRMPAQPISMYRCEEIYRRWGVHISRRQLCIELLNKNFYHSGESAILLLNGQPIGILSFQFDVSSRALNFPFVFTELSRYGEFIQREINNEAALPLMPYRVCTSILCVVISIAVIQ